jgi:hypothetical protein
MLPNLRQFWELSVGDRKAAVAEWSSTKSVASGREAILGGAGDWQRAVTGIERALERLSTVPVSDLAAWRGADGWRRQMRESPRGGQPQRQTATHAEWTAVTERPDDQRERHSRAAAAGRPRHSTFFTKYPVHFSRRLRQ